MCIRLQPAENTLFPAVMQSCQTGISMKSVGQQLTAF